MQRKIGRYVIIDADLFSWESKIIRSRNFLSNYWNWRGCVLHPPQLHCICIATYHELLVNITNQAVHVP